jgi:hypothetical protein
MRANLRNQARQTHLPRWKPLLPVFEAIMNSFQAIEDAGGQTDHKITVAIEREPDLLGTKQGQIFSFVITDTGVGFNKENFDSFNELFSERKLPQGGKGVGRTLWLKAFHHVDIDSTFTGPKGELLRRTLRFDENYDPDIVAAPTEGAIRGTRIRLVGFQEPYKSDSLWTTEQVVHRIIEHFLLVFLQPDCPRVELHDYGQVINVNAVFNTEFKASATAHPFEIKGIDFTLHGFRLFSERSARHRLIYAANRRGVIQENLDEYIPNLSRAKLAEAENKSFYYLAIVQSDYLTEKVNPARTEFDLLQDDAEGKDLFADEVTRKEIRDACVQRVQDDLSEVIKSINDAKAESIREYVADAPEYRILMKYLPEFIDQVPPAPSKTEIDTALHKELHQRQVKLRQESGRIIREAERVTDYEQYSRRLKEFMEKFNEVGVSQLANYVSHRKVILEFLERAISRAKDNKYPLESVVHQLIFPLRSTSDDIAAHEHNLWIIDERLTFHSLVTSDKPLSTVPQFAIDSEKRPDLFIFDRRVVFSEDEAPLKSIVLVEFKRPQRNDYTMNDNPITQCLGLIRDIRSGEFKMENGRPVRLASKDIPAFCYIICDITPSLEEVLHQYDAQRMPGGNGYFNFHNASQTYYEVMDYDKILDDSKKRNRIFFDKLNILSQS